MHFSPPLVEKSQAMHEHHGGDFLEGFLAWFSAFEMRPFDAVVKEVCGGCLYKYSDFPFLANNVKMRGSVVVTIKE